MQLTQFTDFGLRMLMYLSYSERDQRVTITEAAEQFSMPRNHLVKVVNRLVKLGWVDATRGRNGGLKLAVKPQKLKLGTLIQQLEASVELIDCEKTPCRLHHQCHLKHLLDDGLKQFYQWMDQYSLADAVADPTGSVIVTMHQAYHQNQNNS